MEWNASKITQQEFRACVYKARTHRQTTLIRATGVAEQDSRGINPTLQIIISNFKQKSNFLLKLKGDGIGLEMSVECKIHLNDS